MIIGAGAGGWNLSSCLAATSTKIRHVNVTFFGWQKLALMIGLSIVLKSVLLLILFKGQDMLEKHAKGGDKIN